MADTNLQRQREARDAAFDDTPLDDPGACPLLTEVAIFPVRYAIDEEPTRADALAPHPLGKSWRGPEGYPILATRGYTLRQLRDGWLYVWVDENGESRLDEYRIEGASFDGQPHLSYPARVRLALAYSPVKWTERIRQQLLADDASRQRLMRYLDPLAALDGTTLHEASPHYPLPAHVGPLSLLADYVADVTPGGAVDGFTSTTVSTHERERHGEEDDDGLYEVLAVKPEITQDSVLARCPRHDEALFVALDDPLGITNDLLMGLLSREARLESLLDEHGHRLHTAVAVQALCGPDDSDLDEAIRDDPAARRRVNALLRQRLEAQEAKNLSEAVNRGGPFGWSNSASRRHHEARIAALDAELAGYGLEPPDGDDLAAWQRRRRWREDVDYEGAVAFIDTHQPSLELLQAHVRSSLGDAVAWLERLPSEGEALCHDPCDEAQSQALLEFAALACQALGASDAGREWMTDTFRARDTLIGTSLFNFSSALAEAFDAIALAWQAGEPEGERGRGVTASDAAGLASHLEGVLSLEHVQESAIFQALAQPIQEGFDALQKVVAGTGKRAWETLAYLALPAVTAGAQVTAQHLARGTAQAMLMAFVHPDNQGVFLQRHDGFEARHRDWRERMGSLANRIKGKQAQLYRPSVSASARAEAFREVARLERDYQALSLEEPKRYTAGTTPGGDAAPPGNRAQVGPLATLGFDELREQHRLRIERGAGGVAADRQRMARWMDARGLGGLPLLVAALNLVNVADSVSSAQRDGMSQADLEKIAGQASYATAAVLSLWVLPYWQRHASQTAPLFGISTKVTGAGVSRWHAGGRSHMARLAAKLSSRVAGMAAFAAIGAGVETWQIIQQYDRTTSKEEQLALWAKGGATFGMSVVGVVQLGGALFGRWFAFGWILAPWASWALLILSAGYLLASVIAEHYLREGVRLWLYESTWGRANRWSDSDADKVAELRALNEALLAPSLKLTPVVRSEYEMSRVYSPYSPGRRVETLQGYWIQLALPAALSGESVTVSEDAAGGFWAPAASFHGRPATRHDMELPGAARYREEDPLRVWQAWLPAEKLPDGQPFLLNVTYDETIYADTHGGLSFYLPQGRTPPGQT